MFTVFGMGISWRDIILIGGGLFLIAKATHEIHGEVERATSRRQRRRRAPVVLLGRGRSWSSIDLVFSLDSIITAIGMAEDIEIMIAAVVIAMIVMYVAVGAGRRAFIAEHPTTKMLALAFLVLIGVALVADGFDFHIPRGYIYFAMAFAGAVEVFNVMARRNRAQQRTGKTAARDRENRGEQWRADLSFSSPARAAASAPRPRGSPPRAATTSAVNYKSDAKSAADVVATVKAHGGNAVSRSRATWAREADVERVFKEVDGSLGPLTHLVYNCRHPRHAPRGSRTRRSAMMRRGDRGQRAGRAVVRCSTRSGACRRSTAAQGGAIVLMSSVPPTLGGPNEYVWYAASKGAIEFDDRTGSSKRARPATASASIALSPGVIDTGIHAAGGTPDQLANGSRR